MAAEKANKPFLYTGEEGGERIPGWVSHVLVDPTTTAIPEGAFQYRPRLRYVELCEGLTVIGRAAFFDCESLERIKIPFSVKVIPEGCFQHCGNLTVVVLGEGVTEIGMHAFDGCTSLHRVDIPATVKTIGKSAFFNSLSTLELPDGIVHIGEYALSQCKFSCLRIPPLIVEISLGVCRSCKNMFTLELPEGIQRIRNYAFSSCQSLRNAFVPREAIVMEYVFQHCTDLEQLFGSHAEIEKELRCRFDGLPIHRLCYFHSYHDTEASVEKLGNAIGMGGAQGSNPLGELRDRIGMTPLHILCCSRKQNLELFRIIVEAYPEQLIAEDKWGELPILYAFWGNAPNEIMQFLVDSYKSIFPDYELKWNKMLQVLSMANAPCETIKYLLDTRRLLFPHQTIHDWDSVVDKLAEPYKSFKEHYASGETFRFMISCSVSDRVKGIGLRGWRSKVMSQTTLVRDGHRSRKADLANFRSMLIYYEGEYHKLKEATSMLELALWKARIMERRLINNANEGTAAFDEGESEYRSQCRISCGADNVIENVLPFLLPAI